MHFLAGLTPSGLLRRLRLSPAHILRATHAAMVLGGSVSHRGPAVLRVCLLAGLVLLGLPRPLSAQLAAATSAAGPTAPARVAAAAESFDETYGELLGLAPVATRVAQVKDVVLQRDLARFTLQQGRIYQLSPIGGRTVGLVFVGQGRFAFAPES